VTVQEKIKQQIADGPWIDWLVYADMIQDERPDEAAAWRWLATNKKLPRWMDLRQVGGWGWWLCGSASIYDDDSEDLPSLGETGHR
jgi:hypothetical protein